MGLPGAYVVTAPIDVLSGVVALASYPSRKQHMGNRIGLGIRNAFVGVMACIAAVGCRSAAPCPDITGEYSGSVGGTALYLDVKSDGTYTKWWVERAGLSIERKWVCSRSRSGEWIVKFDRLGDSFMEFAVRDNGRQLKLVSTEWIGELIKI
jgi:hypothetical protein